MLTETESFQIAEQERLMNKYIFDTSFVRQCTLKIKYIELGAAKRNAPDKCPLCGASVEENEMRK